MAKRANSTVTAVIIMAILSASVSAGTYGGGSGEPNDPYKIRDANDLLALAADTNDYNDCFILVNDINLADYTFTTAVISPDGSQYFAGVFDGNDHKIINLTIDTNGIGKNYLGLFGQIGPNGIVKNLGIEDINIIGGNSSRNIGGLCGQNDGTISNCYASGDLAGNLVIGGLCGFNYRGAISDCYSTGTATGGLATGGLCGDNGGTISDCYSTSAVTGTEYIGGLCGYNYQGTISNSYSTGTVTGYGDDIGGLCGHNYQGTISNCHSAGMVTGYGDGTGGLCGYSNGTISDCYSTSVVTVQAGSHEETGGLVGSNGGLRGNCVMYGGCYEGTITNCYSTGSVTGNIATGGLCGSNYSQGTISNSYSTSVVTGDKGATGGLCGYNNGYISDCYSTGMVDGNDWTGGLCGSNSEGDISSSYSTGSVTGNNYTGGLCGSNHSGTGIWDGYATIASCYSTGTVDGNDNTGGLCGSNDNSTISNCYSSGIVGGNDNTGGLCGLNEGSDIINCYSTGTVSGDDYTGGLCGKIYSGNIGSSYFLETAGLDNGLGTPLTDELMKDEANYIDWEFSYDDGNDADWFMAWGAYPIFTWQISPADLYTDGRNNFKDFAVFSKFWMREDCSIYNYYCEFSDMDFDNDVDIDDLFELMSYWLETGIYNY